MARDGFTDADKEMMIARESRTGMQMSCIATLDNTYTPVHITFNFSLLITGVSANGTCHSWS